MADHYHGKAGHTFIKTLSEEFDSTTENGPFIIRTQWYQNGTTGERITTLESFKIDKNTRMWEQTCYSGVKAQVIGDNLFKFTALPDIYTVIGQGKRTDVDRGIEEFTTLLKAGPR